MNRFSDLSYDSAQVFSHMTLPDLAIILDNLAVEFSTRLCPGVAALAHAARCARERHAALERLPASIHGADCSPP